MMHNDRATSKQVGVVDYQPAGTAVSGWRLVSSIVLCAMPLVAVGPAVWMRLGDKVSVLVYVYYIATPVAVGSTTLALAVAPPGYRRRLALAAVPALLIAVPFSYGAQ